MSTLRSALVHLNCSCNNFNFSLFENIYSTQRPMFLCECNSYSLAVSKHLRTSCVTQHKCMHIHCNVTPVFSQRNKFSSSTVYRVRLPDMGRVCCLDRSVIQFIISKYILTHLEDRQSFVMQNCYFMKTIGCRDNTIRTKQHELTHNMRWLLRW
jgi:hypothetical protein